MAEKTKMLDNWIQQKCTQCKYFKKRDGKQRLDRCTNKEVTTGKYCKETLSGIYYCSEYEPPKDGDTNG